jgi:dethiobiotin synthetase
MIPGVFVTGTDTGVGKTFAVCVLIHALKARGVRPVPMKPIAAGASEIGGAWVNDDTQALMQAAGCPASMAADITPILLREPMAPHIAAAREGRTIDLAPVWPAWARLAKAGTFSVVEGVGGFRVPLAPGVDTVDLAKTYALPVVLVVGLRLGCLNHALLTAEAIERAHLRLAGWIANAIDPQMAVPDENVAALRERLRAPLLGRLPYAPQASTQALARWLDVSSLLG